MTNQSIQSELINEPTEESEFSLSNLRQALTRKWKEAGLISTAVGATILLLSLMQPSQYRSQALILLHNQKAISVVPELFAEKSSNSSVNYATEIQILRSHALINRAMDRFEKLFKNLSLSEITNNLAIGQAGNADILIVSYTDTSPERTKQVLEALTSTYVDYSLERQRSQATNAIKFIEEQLPLAEKELDKIALQIRYFRQENRIVDPETYAEKIEEKRQSLSEQARNTTIEISRLQSQYQNLSQSLRDIGKNPQNSLAETLLGEDLVYQSLSAQLKELETKSTLQKTIFYDDTPIIQNLDIKQQELERLLEKRARQVLGPAISQVDINRVTKVGLTQQNLTNQLIQVENNLTSLQSKLVAIERAQRVIDRDFEKLPRLQENYVQLKSQLDIRSQAVENFLKKLQELKIAEAQEIAPWQVIQPAYLPTNTIAPNIRNTILKAFIWGSAVGIGSALILNRLDRKVKNVEEIKQLTGLSVLATIYKVTNPIIAHSETNNFNVDQDSFILKEAFRSIAINLKYLTARSELVKVLGITSSISGEGKSTITYNLGLVLAELGLKILIVDADLRKPTIHKLAEKSNDVGLTTAIIEDRSYNDFIFSIKENLSVLTSGSIPTNPLLILNSAKMTELIEQWRKSYDYILIDTPPLGLVADAQSLIDRVDRTIFVSAIEKATRPQIKHCMEILRVSNSKLAGLVTNLVDLELNNYQHYYHYYDGLNKIEIERKVESA